MYKVAYFSRTVVVYITVPNYSVQVATARQIYGSMHLQYKAKTCKLLVLITHAQKTKFIFK